MLAEFLKALIGEVQKPNTRFLQHDDLPGRVWADHSDGTLNEIARNPRDRDASIGSLQDLVRYVTDPIVCKAPEVYVSTEKIDVLLDRADRNEVATMFLAPSSRWLSLQAISEKPFRAAPKDIVKWLRFALHDNSIGHVIQALSRLDFTRTSTGRTNVSHGRESLGSSVEAEVQGIERVPESFLVSIPVWSTPGVWSNVNIELGIYIDLTASVVELHVMPDAMQTALQQATFGLAASLRDSMPNVPVFVGRP